MGEYTVRMAATTIRDGRIEGAQDTLARLVADVNARLREGWQCLGGVSSAIATSTSTELHHSGGGASVPVVTSICPITFTQAMTRG